MKHGMDPRVRTTDTEAALGALEACGYLDSAVAAPLRDGYRLLRRLEQRLRVLHGTSAQLIEEGAPGLAPLARRMGMTDGPQAAVRTQKIKNGQGLVSDGYVVVPRGTTQTFDVNVFSSAPLPNDLNFYVGVPKLQATDPSDLGSIAPGVTASLSITSGHNGNGALLTVSTDKTAALGDTLFVVRSVLAQNDFHDWPVIVHVK